MKKTKRAAVRKAAGKAQRPSIGPRLVEALTRARDAVRSGRPLDELMTVRTYVVADPKAYTANDVRHVRSALRASQTVFAALLGVSPELVEHWEQGLSVPRPIAARLMDEISRDPAGYRERYVTRTPAAEHTNA